MSPAKSPLDEFLHAGTRTDAVYAMLRRWIVCGTLAPSEKLRAEALAKKIKVSRTPVREALRKLEAEGFVVTSTRHGLVVAALDEQDLTEIFQVREVLEGAAARLAAENATPSEIARMREVIGEMEKIWTGDDLDAMGDLSAEYHQMVYAASRNNRLRQALTALQDRTRQFRTSLFCVPGHPALALADYRSLLHAIETRDGDLAERVARDHRKQSFAVRRRLLREKSKDDRPGHADVAKSRRAGREA